MVGRDVTPQPLVSPFKYYKFRLLEHVLEFFFLYSSIASLYTLIPSVLARSLSELFVEPRSPVKSHQGDLHKSRDIGTNNHAEVDVVVSSASSSEKFQLRLASEMHITHLVHYRPHQSLLH